VCDDGDYHHLYCDLTIKKPDSPHLEALLELIATARVPQKIRSDLNPRIGFGLSPDRIVNFMIRNPIGLKKCNPKRSDRIRIQSGSKTFFIKKCRFGIFPKKINIKKLAEMVFFHSII